MNTLQNPITERERKHEQECDAALEAIAKKRWGDKALKVYSLGKSVSTGAVMGHAVLGAEAIPVVKSAATSAFGSFVAGRVAFLAILQGWGASGSAKRYGFPGFKRKQADAVDKSIAEVKKLKGAKDWFESRFSIPSLELYEAQGRVLTGRQRVGLTFACLGEATLITGVFFGAVHLGTHYLIAQNAGSIVHPKLPLGEKTVAQQQVATHASHVLHSHPFLSRMWTGIVNNDSKLSVLPDKIVGLAGLLAVTKPLKVSSSYRRRRIVCKRYFEGRHVLNLPFTPVRRKVYRRPLGFIPRPLLERAIQDEIEHRAECAAQGRAVITKPKQLSPQMRHQAKAEAYGHAVI